MNFRPILLAWLLLLGATLAMAAGAWWLLDREADRVEAVTAGAIANGAASVAEGVDLLMEEIRNGVTGGLISARNAPNPRTSLSELVANNPYVLTGFYYRASDGVTVWYGERGESPSPSLLKAESGGDYPWSVENIEEPVKELSAAELNTILQDVEDQRSQQPRQYAPTDVYENMSQAVEPKVVDTRDQEQAEPPAQYALRAKSEALKQQRANVRQVIILSNRSDEVVPENQAGAMAVSFNESPPEPMLKATGDYVVDDELGGLPTPTEPTPVLLPGKEIKFLEGNLNLAKGERKMRATSPRYGWVTRDVADADHWMIWADLPDSANIIGAWLNRDAVMAELSKTINISQLNHVQFTLIDDRGRPIAGALRDRANRFEDVEPELVLPVGATLPGWRIEAYPALRENPFGRSFRLLGGLSVAGLCLAILLGGSLLLWQAQRDARDAQRKTTFVANVSHELKTPLTSIRLFAEMLHDGRAGDEAKQRRYLQTMLNETQRLTRLVNNVLDFSRLERGRRDFQAESIDLGKTVGGILEAQRERLHGDGLTLELIEPQASIGAKVDRDALEQILLNLLDNAAKYAGSGERAVVQLTREAAAWRLSVCDFGPGILAAERRQVFEAFHRIDDRLTAERPGCGLGLSIAARLAHGIGGQLTLRENQPHGCCFELTAPLQSDLKP